MLGPTPMRLAFGGEWNQALDIRCLFVSIPANKRPPVNLPDLERGVTRQMIDGEELGKRSAFGVSPLRRQHGIAETPVPSRDCSSTSAF